MKRLIYPVLAMLIVLSACSAKSPNVFERDEIKKLDKYKNTSEVYSRYYDEYTDTLRASDDYGELVPYIGRMLDGADGEFAMRSYRYGMCTTDGKIVVDPVFDDAFSFSTDAGCYYQLSYAKTADDVDEMGENDWDLYKTRSVLAKSDGSKVISLPKNSYANGICSENMSSDGIVVFESSEDEYYYGTNFYMYDKDLKMRFYVMNIYNYPVYSDGLAPFMISDGNGGVADVYYLDENGKKMFDCTGFSEIYEFSCGLARVRDRGSGLYGFINTDGEYVIEPKFDVAGEFTSEGRATVTEGYDRYIIDREGDNILGRTLGSDFCLMQGGEVYYLFGDNWPPTYRYVESGEPIKCPVCGKTSANSDFQTTYEEGGRTLFIHRKCDGCSTLFSADESLIQKMPESFSSYSGFLNDDYLMMVTCEVEGADGKMVVYDRKSGKVIDTIEDYFNYGDRINDDSVVLADYSGDTEKYVVYTFGKGLSDGEYDNVTVFDTRGGRYAAYVRDGMCGAFDENFNDIIRMRLDED